MIDKFELTDEDTGEVHVIPLDGMVGGLRDMLMDRRRAQLFSVPWSHLTEESQKDEITAANEYARTVVYKLAEVIAEGGRQCAHVSVQKFAVDVEKGELTVTCKGYAQDETLLDLVHAKGKVAKLTVVDPEQFNRHSKPLQATPDQPTFFGEDVGSGEGVETSDAEIEDLGAEMDAELDAMDEPEDLHNDTPAEPEAEEAADFERVGYDARMRGDGPDENPFDGGTDESAAWQSGYDRANTDVSAVIEEGAQAARNGKDILDCEWKKGSDAEKFWLHGFNAAQGQIEDDSHEQGRLAADLGLDIEANPYPKKSIKRRFWDEGFNSHKPPKSE